MSARAQAAADAAPALLTVRCAGREDTVAPGHWNIVPTADPVDVAERCAGARPGAEVVLGGVQLPPTPAGRVGAGLGVATCRLPPIAGLRVLDVVLLGVRGPQPSLWEALLGRAAVRAQREDQCAAARALAGRTGLARWLDAPAADLPVVARALTDVTRALLSAPRALVWCRPEWLDEGAQSEIAAVITEAQTTRPFPILELCTEPTRPPVEGTSLPTP